MGKFILGYPPNNFDKLIEYPSKEEADINSDEWFEIEAASLQEAIDKYQETVLNEQKQQDIKHGCYTTK